MLRPHVADNAVSGWWRTRATRDSFCIVLLRDRDVEWSNQSAQGHPVFTIRTPPGLARHGALRTIRHTDCLLECGFPSRANRVAKPPEGASSRTRIPGRNSDGWLLGFAVAGSSWAAAINPRVGVPRKE